MNGFRTSVVVIDDFYPDPESVRSCALTLPYQEASTQSDWKYYKGRLSTPHHAYSALGMRMLESVLARPLIWERPVGEFRLLYAERASDPGGALWIHSDAGVADYSAVIFLNPPEQCQGHLRFYRHRALGIDRIPEERSRQALELVRDSGHDWARLIEVLSEDGYDIETKWEITSTVETRFNRCVIFDATMFHSRSSRFGLHRGEARLTQNYFFRTSLQPQAFGIVGAASSW